MQLSDSFETKEEKPAVECIARFININYGHNRELMDSCKRLHDYSYFVACVRDYLRKGLSQKGAVRRAVDDCIRKGILEDVLLKHRAEVEGMFLTTFDKKMYEEAIKMDAKTIGLREGRAEGRVLKLKELIQKKLQKGYSAIEIAEALEEEIETIEKMIMDLK